uniref:Uncharacterized protein n=1 Tax=Picea sitchensis TaxID=3332 RepID=D5AAU2_PICSI|nr:unknown [Picea sitchensis]
MVVTFGWLGLISSSYYYYFLFQVYFLLCALIHTLHVE